MARRFNMRSTPKDVAHFLVNNVPWRLLILVPALVVLAIPTFIYGTHAGANVIPSVTNLFYKLSSSPTPTPVVMPPFSPVLPLSGSIQYTAQDGDSCDSILAYQMRMSDAGQIFSDSKSSTVTALNHVLGLNCNDLQPGTSMKLTPHYPLVAMGGEIMHISSSATQQAVPTPLIPVQNQQDAGPDCTGGCTLAVQIAPSVRINLVVQTALTLHVDTWTWFQARMPLQSVAGFSNYPYADPNTSLNGKTMQACDFQAGSVHDDNSLSCDQLSPNTIDDDGGSWMLGVMGPSGLEHWHYAMKVPVGTRLLMWLENDSNGNLTYHSGDPVYRYDPSAKLYVKY